MSMYIFIMNWTQQDPPLPTSWRSSSTASATCQAPCARGSSLVKIKAPLGFATLGRLLSERQGFLPQNQAWTLFVQLTPPCCTPQNFPAKACLATCDRLAAGPCAGL